MWPYSIIIQFKVHILIMLVSGAKCKDISPKIHWRRFKVDWIIFTFIFTSNKWIGKLWVLNDGQKMDEWVKYLKVTYGQFSLSFYRQLKFPLIQILNAVLYKTRKTHSINLKTPEGVKSIGLFHINSSTKNLVFSDLRLLRYRCFKFHPEAEPQII